MSLDKRGIRHISFRGRELGARGHIGHGVSAGDGSSLYAMHYVCPGIGKVALMDELAAFSNQTARNPDAALNQRRVVGPGGLGYRAVQQMLQKELPLAGEQQRPALFVPPNEAHAQFGMRDFQPSGR